MKKYFVIILCFFLMAPLNATRYEHDSLRLFLENIGEDSVRISHIMSSPDTINPNDIVHYYLSFWRLRINPSQQYEWYIGWGDSLYVSKYVKYMYQKIVKDTVLNFIDEYLCEAYLMIHYQDSAANAMLRIAEYAIENFHARGKGGSAYLIPNLYYYNKKVKDFQKYLQYYEMIKMILSPTKNFYCFDEQTNKKLRNIMAIQNGDSPYYFRFRFLLDSYSDIELARLSQKQEKELVDIILQGIDSGEKKSQLTYAFMLLTGQFVEKNEPRGEEILLHLLQ